ncbi:MAG TPA: LysR substrate-binding domain-containing protein [Planctomycetota bacterium]|jgi:DNA-binding transcriptional LysR family regulator|nr:LysR substrate-binding domain-containing protein [Planctomycetota bacterium]
MELRHLKYFVAVADELHFGRAASRLQISQPPLSQQIRRLEEELGVELFRRTKRKVQLTSAGRAFLDRARQLLQEVERAVEATRQAARGVVGRIEVGYAPTAEIRVIPRLLKRIRERSPKVEVGLHLLNPADLTEALRQSRIDVALTRLPLDEEGIRTERFLREELLLAVGARSLLARGETVRPERLQGVPLLMFPRGLAPAMHDSIVGYFRAAGVSPHLAYAIGSISGGLGLIASGMGVSIVPESVKDIRFSGVVYRRLAAPAPWSDMGIARLREAPTPLQDFFRRAVRDLFPGRAKAARRR